MKKRLLLFVSLLVLLGGQSRSYADDITPAGAHLIDVLESMHVDKLWLAGNRVNWRTGEATGTYDQKLASHTHCSAFAAAAAEKLGVYLLHPPEHSVRPPPQVAVLSAVNASMSGSATLNLQFTGSATAPSSTNVFWQSPQTWRIVTLSGGAGIAGLSFSSIVNGSYAAGTFSTSNDASGVLLIFTPTAAAPSVPKVNHTSLSGNQFVFSGTNGTASGTYYVVTSTNAALALSSWVTIATNTFSGGGNFTNSITINTNDRAQFFRLKVP